MFRGSTRQGEIKVDEESAGRFIAGAYLAECQKLAEEYAEEKGIQSYLYKNNVILHSLDKKNRSSMTFNWRGASVIF